MSTGSFLKPKSGAGMKPADFIAVVTDKQSEDVIKSYVIDQVMPHTHVQMGSLDDMIRILQQVERSPSRLVVDISGSTMAVSELARLAEACEPSVKVIVVGDRNDVGLYRSLLQLGIHDYLVKPLTSELLSRTLDSSRTSGTTEGLRTGKVISFIGTRGGTGVTSIAVNLARYLADVTHRRIAYVDLQPYGGTANVMLGLTTNNGLSDLLQNIHRLDPQFIDRTLVAKSNRLFVLSSEVAYGTDLEVRTGAIKQLVAALKHHFHYVLLDLPGRGGTIMNDAIDNSKLVYLVADHSVHSAREVMRLRRYTESRPSEPDLALLLNNPVDPVQGRVSTADFKAAVSMSILQEFPFDGKALAQAENLGELVVEKGSAGFLDAIAQLAGSLSGHKEKVISAPRFGDRLRNAIRKR
jgi:pilus assembly protein CpaE